MWWVRTAASRASSEASANAGMMAVSDSAIFQKKSWSALELLLKIGFCLERMTLCCVIVNGLFKNYSSILDLTL